MKLMIALLSLLSVSAFAAEKTMNIEETKKSMIADFDERITHLQTAKTCVQAAGDEEKIKECHKTFRATMKKHHKDRKGKKAEWRKKQ